MKNLMSKSAILMMLFGLLFVASASDANAQDRCRSRNRVSSRDYYDDDYYRRVNNRNRFDDDDFRTVQNRRRGRDIYYEENEDTTGRALRRTGIGAGVGALGGALIGGKKGAAIGAGIGAAGGYIYHRKKVGDQRDRFRY